MKGELHDRLRAVLRKATADGTCTQESLAVVMGKTQTGVGKYLLGKGGALDVDEADAALHHIGSSLAEFLAKLPQRAMSHSDRLARELATRPDLAGLVADLLPVPRTQLAAVIEMVRGLVLPAIGTRAKKGGGSKSGPTQARNTTHRSSKHR